MLLFAHVFSANLVARIVHEEVGEADDRAYTPLVTLATFLAQIFSNEHSCRGAVARLRSWRVARGLPSCSPATGGYCIARQRLPETLFSRLVCATSKRLQQTAPSDRLFHDRSVVIVDGNCVSMPDTPKNRSAYPQHPHQKRGCGFPIARIVVLLSLATGAVLDLAIGPWSGKLSGENALLRGLRNSLKAGNILLGDSYYSSYQEVAALLELGVDVVMRQYGGWPTDLREGQKLGRIAADRCWPRATGRVRTDELKGFRRPNSVPWDITLACAGAARSRSISRSHTYDGPSSSQRPCQSDGDRATTPLSPSPFTETSLAITRFCSVQMTLPAAALMNHQSPNEASHPCEASSPSIFTMKKPISSSGYKCSSCVTAAR